jgi:hypothetical protein
MFVGLGYSLVMFYFLLCFIVISEIVNWYILIFLECIVWWNGLHMYM